MAIENGSIFAIASTLDDILIKDSLQVIITGQSNSSNNNGINKDIIIGPGYIIVNNSKDIKEIKIYDMKGVIVYSKTLFSGENYKIFPRLNTGIYILSISRDKSENIFYKFLYH
jgi:hypothetical protein